MSRGLGTALETGIREYVRREMDDAAATVQLGTISQLNPLQIELFESATVLYDDEITVAQEADTHRVGSAWEVGDTAVLVRKRYGGDITWVVAAVLADRDPLSYIKAVYNSGTLVTPSRPALDFKGGITAVDNPTSKRTEVSVADPAYDALQAGVVSGGALSWLSLTSVQLAAGVAMVPDASGVLKRVSWSTTTISGIPGPSGGSGFGRLDQIVVSSTGVVSRQGGTDPVSATNLINLRTGADDTGIGAGKLRLWDMAASSTAGGISSAASFRDRRLWARGVYNRITRAVASLAYTLTTTAAATPFPAIDSTNLAMRVEVPTGGAEFLLGFSGRWYSQVGYPYFGWLIDGTLNANLNTWSTAPSIYLRPTIVTPVQLAAGSHLIQPAWSVDRASSDSILAATPADPLYFWVQEQTGRLGNFNGTA